MERVYQNKKSSVRSIKQDIILAGTILNIFANSYIIGEFDSLHNYTDKEEPQNSIIQTYNENETELSTEITSTEIAETEIKISKSKSAQPEETVKKEDEQQFKSMSLPDCDTSFKAYMDYRCITNKASDQYKLQQEAWTDDLGLRRCDDYYLIAIGTYYSGSIGDKFKITLDDNKIFYAMTGDIKADIHTDTKNMYSAVYDNSGSFISANVIEFIVDTNQLNRKIKLIGSIDAYDDFSGNIVKIEKIIE